MAVFSLIIFFPPNLIYSIILIFYNLSTIFLLLNPLIILLLISLLLIPIVIPLLLSSVKIFSISLSNITIFISSTISSIILILILLFLLILVKISSIFHLPLCLNFYLNYIFLVSNLLFLIFATIIPFFNSPFT